MQDLANRTVAETVSENIKTAHVFKKHGIDFCCGGSISIAQACVKNKVDLGQITTELLATENTSSYLNDYNSWELDFLIDFIVHTHHTYVEKNIVLLKQYATKVAKVHGHHYTELHEIVGLIHTVSDELTTHMKKEELILFPFVKKLVRATRDQTSLSLANFTSIANPIQMMEEEHDAAGDIFKRINVLTKTYQAPDGACNTFKAFYAKLEEFESDLHHHVHLENNILFPKAAALEAKFSERQDEDA